jgi:hypothetical protein
MISNGTTTEVAPVEVGDYAMASGLFGFGKTIKEVCNLRVKVIRIAGPFDIIVKTASLLDAGSMLAVRPEQLRPCE